MRNLTSNLITAFESSSVRLAIFVEMQLASGTARFWSGAEDKALDGNTYTGLGDLTGLDFPEESSSGVANGLDLAISGIRAQNISFAMENYQYRPAIVYLAALNSSDAIIADPYEIFNGFIDIMTIFDNDSQADIRIKLEGYAYGVGPSLSRYTNEDQKRKYSTDTGLQYVRSLSQKTVYWGTASAETANNTGTGQYLSGNGDSFGYIDLDGDGEYDEYIP